MSSQTHKICSESCIYCCKRAVTYLVSLAVGQHENQARNVLVRKTDADLSRVSTLGPKLDQLNFRPPTSSLHQVGYPPNKVQTSSVRKQHTLSAIVQSLNTIAGPFRISPRAPIDEYICFRLDHLQHSCNIQDICEILQVALDEQQAAVEWRNWPWTFVHDLIREQLSKHVRVQDGKSLNISVPVSSTFLLSATLIT